MARKKQALVKQYKEGKKKKGVKPLQMEDIMNILNLHGEQASEQFREDIGGSAEKRQGQEELSDGGTTRTSSSSARKQWSNVAISCLLDACSDKFTQLNRGNLRGRDWEEVALKVSEKVSMSVEQCVNKIDNLKRRYKRERQRMSNRGTTASHWHWFKKMEEIFASFFVTKDASNEDRSCSGTLGNAVEPRPIQHDFQPITLDTPGIRFPETNASPEKKRKRPRGQLKTPQKRKKIKSPPFGAVKVFGVFLTASCDDDSSLLGDDQSNPNQQLHHHMVQEELSDGGTTTRTSSSSARKTWSSAAISCLLDACSDKFTQLNRRNLRARDWEEVALRVSEKLSMSVEQCVNKIDNLKRRYKQERHKMSNNGTTASRWPWFKKMEEIFASFLETKDASDEDGSYNSEDT